MKRTHRHRRRAGFTLIELLVVIVTVLLLAVATILNGIDLDVPNFIRRSVALN